MKIQAFQALFRESKGHGDKSAVIHGYTQLIYDIESTKKYPEWFNHISLNIMLVLSLTVIMLKLLILYG